MTVITRFAPSPTGYLHLGHAHAALFAEQAARRAGGTFLLRIEDIDTSRCRPEFTNAILEDLAWLGLRWDGEPRVQSQHFEAYRTCVSALAARDLVYPCFCTRADIAASASAPHGPEGPIYPGTCRSLPSSERTRRQASEPHAMRLDMAKAVHETAGSTEASAFGDVVIARRDTPGSYHLCSVHDDAAQGVTLVTRACDLAPARHLHRLLQNLFGWPHPEYAHFPLLTDAHGRRLSKRDDATTLRALRASGLTPASVRALAGFA